VASYTDSRRRVDELVSDAERRLRDAFLLAVAAARLSRAEVERLLLEGRSEEILRRLFASSRALASAYQDALLRAARDTADDIADQLGRPLAVDLGSSQTARLLREAHDRIALSVESAQRAALTAALLAAARRGLGARETAGLVLASLGLSAAQVEALASYQDLLRRASREALDRQLRDESFDPAVEQAAVQERPLTDREVDRMTAAYAGNLLLYRAGALGLSEGLAATHQGLGEALRQAVDEGLLEESTIVRRWTPRRDSRVRDSHVAMRGQERPEGEAFVSGLGNRLRYPGDPDAPAADRVNCRCVLVVRAGAPTPAEVV